MKHGMPLMVGTGGGSVVLLGSVLGAIGSPGYAAYCASKGALVNLAKQAAIEHAPDGVRVNVVSPSACETGLFLEMVSQRARPGGDQADGGRAHADGSARAPRPTSSRRSCSSRRTTRRTSAGTTIPLDGGLAARRSVTMHDGFRVLDADAHVIEPRGPVRRRRAAGGRRHRPAADHARWSRAAIRPSSPTSSPTAARPASTCGAWTARASTRSCSTRRSGCSCRSCRRSLREASAGACRAYNEWIAEYRTERREPAHRRRARPDRRRRARGARSRARRRRSGSPASWCGRTRCTAATSATRRTTRCTTLLEERDLTLSVHEGLGVMGPTIGRDRSETFAMRHAMSHPMEQMAAMGSLMLARRARTPPRPPGRVPRVRHRLAALLAGPARRARGVDGRDARRPRLSLRPSEYFDRQCVICTDPDDPLAAWVVGRSARTTSCGRPTSRTPTRSTPTRWSRSCTSPRSTA